MTEKKRIVYRGVPMIEGWPEKIQAAQLMTSLTLEDRAISRVRYGDEQHDWKTNKVACHDCAVIKGEFHVFGCDVEECPACAGQLLSCECEFFEPE